MQTYVKEAGWIGIGGGVISHPNSSNSGVHNPERATAMYSCHSVLTDQFILRTNLARIQNIILVT